MTYSGFDAFWAERVKKEVVTQMRHQEEHGVVDTRQMADFYQIVSGRKSNYQSR